MPRNMDAVDTSSALLDLSSHPKEMRDAAIRFAHGYATSILNHLQVSFVSPHLFNLLACGTPLARNSSSSPCDFEASVHGNVCLRYVLGASCSTQLSWPPIAISHAV